MNDKTKDSIFLKKDEKNNVHTFTVNEDYKKVKGLNHKDLMAIKPKEIEFIMHPWLPTQGIAFIYAATGVGKTLFTMNVAYAIAGGGEFLKYKAPLPRKVLYIDGEMSFTQIHSRYVTIVKQQGDLDFPENFILLNPQTIGFNSMPQLCDELGQEIYNKFIEENEIEVVVIDNLSMLSSIDENNSQEWKMIQNWLIHLRSKGLSTIIVHHAGKEKKGYRGTSRMLDCADVAISLQDITGPDLETDNFFSKKFKIEYQKNRCFGGKDAISFEVELNQLGWKHESMEKNNTMRIIEMALLKMRPSEISIELGIHRSHIYKVIKKAKKDGLIREE